MYVIRTAWAAALSAMLPLQASEATQRDFAGLAICAKLNAMPTRYRAKACDPREPLRGECRFSLTSNGMSVNYLVANGTVVEKSVILGGRADVPGPYGLRRGDSYDSAARKVRSSASLSSRHWTDDDDPDVSYLQSDDVPCGDGLSYTIYVWFKDGKAESVSVSTLPVI